MYAQDNTLQCTKVSKMLASTAMSTVIWQHGDDPCCANQLICCALSFRIIGLQELQDQLEAQKQVTSTAEQKHEQHCNELQSSLKEAWHAAASLESQLAAVQLELATEQKSHQDAQHAVADLELQLQVTLVYAAGK